MLNINGKHYAWSQIEFSIAGLTIADVTSISYEETQERELVYGAGNRPTGYGDGNIECSASVTLKMEGVQKLQALAPDGRLQSISPFEVSITYLNPQNDIVTDTLRNCLFMTNKRELNQNDKSFDVELDILLTHIEWNGNPIT